MYAACDLVQADAPLFVVLNLYRMCQCVLQAGLSSRIGILMRLVAEETRSTAGLLFLSQRSLFNDLADPVFDEVRLENFKSRANAFLIT